jgi:DNA gyrase/topoisomerase IV subunit B
MRELAAFHPLVRFTIEQEADGQRRDFHYPNGLLSLAHEIEHTWWDWHVYEDRPSQVWHCRLTEGTEAAEVVFVRRPGGPALVHSFVNENRTVGAGSHVDGLRDGVDAVAASYAGRDENPFFRPSFGDPLADMTTLLAVRLNDPRYYGSTRDQLEHEGARELVRRMIVTILPEQVERSRRGRR